MKLRNRETKIKHEEFACTLGVSSFSARKMCTYIPNHLVLEVMQHPYYSPDIALSDFHLFRSLQNHLGLQWFNSMDEINKVLNEFFEEKPHSFYERSIMTLPQR